MTEESQYYIALVNHEEQYSIWPAIKPIPSGWRHAGKTGLKEDVVEYIAEVWTDMRPLSIRLGLEKLRSRGDNKA